MARRGSSEMMDLVSSEVRTQCAGVGQTMSGQWTAKEKTTALLSKTSLWA